MWLFVGNSVPRLIGGSLFALGSLVVDGRRCAEGGSMKQLVLSLMPGVDLLGMAFKESGFCVVQGGDVIFGGDVRAEHYPPGKFDGIISGPPCQMFSRLAHMVRHNGYEPKFGNLIPEFERCVNEANPMWFVMENVPDAPEPLVCGYSIHSFCLNNRQLGAIQNRVRRWSFGFAMEKRINAKSGRAFREVCRKQGLSKDFDLPGFTVAAKCQAVGNGVPMAMGRAIAKAVVHAIAPVVAGGAQ